MTTNAFLFSWCMDGVEGVIPITEYEDFEEKQIFEILSTGQVPKRSPLNSIVNMLILRARFNAQRFYEIYAIDCDESFTKDIWENLWESDPQGCAALVREKGVKLFGKPMMTGKVKITG